MFINKSAEFIEACGTRELDEVKNLFDREIDQSTFAVAFNRACVNGKLHIAMWMYEYTVHSDDFINAVLDKVLGTPHVETAKWLNELAGSENRSLFVKVLSSDIYNNIHLKWIVDIGTDVWKNVEYYEEQSVRRIFFKYVGYRLEIKAFDDVYTMQTILNTLDVFDQDAFMVTLFLEYCKRGNLLMAKYLYSKYSPMINVFDDAFILSFESNLDLSHWLYSVAGNKEKIINHFYKKCVSIRKQLLTNTLKDYYKKNNIVSEKVQYDEDIFTDDSFVKGLFLKYCKQGDLNLAKYLYSKNSKCSEVVNEAFISSFKYLPKDLLEWLFSIAVDPVQMMDQFYETGKHFHYPEWISKFVMENMFRVSRNVLKESTNLSDTDLDLIDRINKGYIPNDTENINRDIRVALSELNKSHSVRKNSWDTMVSKERELNMNKSLINIKFVKYCEQGNLDRLSKMCVGKIDEVSISYGLERACENGYLDVVKYIIQYTKHYVHGVEYMVAFENNKTEIIEYLELKFDKIDDLLLDVFVKKACEQNNLTPIIWAHNRGSKLNVNELITISCKKGYLSISKWLKSIGVPLRMNDCILFDLACKHNQLDIAQWLYSEEAHSVNKLHINLWNAYINGNVTLAKWIHSIDSTVLFRITLDYEKVRLPGLEKCLPLIRDRLGDYVGNVNVNIESAFFSAEVYDEIKKIFKIVAK